MSNPLAKPDPVPSAPGERWNEEEWRVIDARLAAGELDATAALHLVLRNGLVRKANRVSVDEKQGALWILEPTRERLVPGPRILLDCGRWGGARIYRPTRALTLTDTGPFSGPLPSDWTIRKQ
jgi:hypothetical protein